MLEFRDEDARLMEHVQAKVVHTILPYRERIEAALVVFALVRCARTLLRLYPTSTQKALTRVVVDFLEGRTEPRPELTESGLILPPSMLQ